MISYVFLTTDTSDANASVSVTYNGNTTNYRHDAIRDEPILINGALEFSYAYYQTAYYRIVARKSCIFNGALYSNGDVVASWRYNSTINYTIYEYNFTNNIILEDNPLELVLTDNVELQANFELAGQQVSASVNPSGYGSVSGAGVYPQGASVTLTATPNFGKKFDGWYENNILVSTDNPYTFTMGSSARAFVAQFSNKEWIQPIYDRTIMDLRNKTSKAYLNAVDLNRIETNCEIISISTQISITTKAWKYGDIPKRSDFNRISNNILTLVRWAYPDYQISNISTNYQYINELEEALQRVYDRIHSAVLSQPQCGYYNANEPNVLVAERN